MTQSSNQPFFELRQYQIKEGQLENWVEYMDNTLIPFQRSCGMVIVGSWYIRETNKYVWIRRFESEEDKERLYKAAYENDYWLNEARAHVGTMVDREAGLDIQEMVASPLSVMR